MEIQLSLATPSRVKLINLNLTFFIQLKNKHHLILEANKIKKKKKEKSKFNYIISIFFQLI